VGPDNGQSQALSATIGTQAVPFVSAELDSIVITEKGNRKSLSTGIFGPLDRREPIREAIHHSVQKNEARDEFQVSGLVGFSDRDSIIGLVWRCPCVKKDSTVVLAQRAGFLDVLYFHYYSKYRSKRSVGMNLL
jgi:hypothetical protein